MRPFVDVRFEWTNDRFEMAGDWSLSGTYMRPVSHASHRNIA